MFHKFDIPPVWTLVCVLAVCLVDAFIYAGFSNNFVSYIGWGLMIGAMGLIFASAIWFMRKKTPIHPGHKPKVFITEGIYRYSRNPIYLAMLIFVLGVSCALGQPIGLIFTVLLGVVLKQRFIKPEESSLTEAFGSEAEQYFRSTPRWV